VLAFVTDNLFSQFGKQVNMIRYILALLFLFFTSCAQASPPTGEELIQLLIDNKEKVISSDDGWCKKSENKPLSSEIIRILSPHSKFEDDFQEDLHYQCTDSVYESNSNAIPVWQCQIGVVETKKKDKEYFASRSIFFSINKKSNKIYMNSIRCMD